MKPAIRLKVIVPIALFLLLQGILLFGQADRNSASYNRGNQAYWGSLDSATLLVKLDQDKDGYISRQEWEFIFASQDGDEDQRLSREEIQGFLRLSGNGGEEGQDDGRLAAFERLDSNKNNRIDPPEWPGKAKDYRYLDSDHDGFLSREEFLSKNGRWWNETFQNLDFNGDKVISRPEWLDSNTSFNRLDRDNNGAIDRGEFYNPR